MGRTLVRWRWRYYCEIREKYLITPNLLSEDLIKGAHPDAQPVPGTRVEIELSDDPLANSTSAFLDGLKLRP